MRGAVLAMAVEQRGRRVIQEREEQGFRRGEIKSPLESTPSAPHVGELKALGTHWVRVFASWPLRAGLITQTVFWCQQAASYLVLGLYLQQGRGLSPLAAGAVFAFLAAGYLITSFQAPALTMRFGRNVIAAGAVLAAAANGALYLATAHGGTVAWLFPGLVLLGAGQGLCITPLTTTVLSHADPATAGSVSGALSTAQQVGNSIGVAVTGVLFFGALSHGYGLAFERSVLQMGALLLAVAALTRLMPRRQRTA